MMKIKESGMAGKAKVAVVFAAVVVFSMVIVQCNSKLEESEVSLESPSLIAPPPPPINLPQVGDVGKFNPDLDLSNSIVFNIDNDVLHVNGKVCDLDDLAGVLNEFDSNERTIAVFFIHQDQTMRFVRDVQDVLRLENRLKVVYQAIDEQGKSVELPLLLSPHPDSPEGFKFPKITPEYASEYDIEAMFVHVEENGALNNAKKVNDMVQNHIKTSDDRFVVSIKSDDQDAYGDYFKNLFHIHQVFDKIYEQRAQEMFGVSFYDIDRKNSEGMEQYKAVREGIPRNISIAERD